MFGAPPSSPGPMNTLPSGFGSMNGPSFNSNYMPSRTMPAPISNNPNLIPGTLPGIQPNMRPNMMSGTGPGVFPSAPRSVSPQPYGSRTLSPQFNPLGPNPLINNQYSRNIIPPSQPVLGGRSRLVIPSAPQPFIGGPTGIPPVPIMGGSAVRIGRPLSPVPGAAFGVQPPIPPMSPPIYGGGSAVRIGQPPVQQVFGGSAVRLGGAYSAQVMPGPRKATSRIQYIPYSKKIVDYEPQQVYSSMWVPVQKKCLNYYGIQHITQYIPRQVDDVRYQVVPQQQYYYKLQYVPVQRQIIHLPNQGGYQYAAYNQYSTGVTPGFATGVSTGITPGFATGLSTGIPPVVSPGAVHGFTHGVSHPYSNYNAAAVDFIPGYQPLQSRIRGTVPKTNYVTSEGYVPSYLRPQNSLPSYLPFAAVGPSDFQRNLNNILLKDSSVSQYNLGVNRNIGDAINKLTSLGAQSSKMQRGIGDGIKQLAGQTNRNSYYDNSNNQFGFNANRQDSLSDPAFGDVVKKLGSLGRESVGSSKGYF